MGALKTLIQNLEYFYCVFVEDFAPIEIDFMEKEISTFFDKKCIKTLYFSVCDGYNLIQIDP